MKQAYAIPNALAATTAIIYVLCRILVGLFPDASFIIAQSWFHGIAVTRVAGRNLSFESFILGAVSSTVTAWLVGFIYIKVYRFFTK